MPAEGTVDHMTVYTNIVVYTTSKLRLRSAYSVQYIIFQLYYSEEKTLQLDKISIQSGVLKKTDLTLKPTFQEHSAGSVD